MPALPSKPFLDLLASTELVAYERQLSLPEVFQGDWFFDMGAGTVTFSRGEETVEVPVQILGTESHVHGTWLWGWANEASGIPASLLQAAGELRSHGEDEDIPELRQGSFPLERAEGHTLAMVALGLLPSAPGYYRCPYEGGALFVLLVDPRVNPHPDRPLLRLTTVLSQVSGLVHLPAALAGYARRYRLEVVEDEGAWVVRGREGQVHVEVDDQGRLAGAAARLEPEARP